MGRKTSAFACALIGALLCVMPQAALAQFGFDNPVSIRAVPQSEQVRAGDRIAVAFVLDHDDKWHTWPSAAQDVLDAKFEFAIRTEVAIDSKPDWIEAIYTTQWPEPHDGGVPDPDTGMPTTAPLYSDTAIVFLPIAIAADAQPGDVTLTIAYTYQTCNDTMCLPPEMGTLDVELQVVAAGAAVADPSEPALFTGFDAKVFAGSATNQQSARGAESSDDAATTSADSSEAPTLFGWQLPSPTSLPGLLVLFIASVLGGAILNLTPCVLPMIPIKIMALTQHGGTKRHSLMLGFAMALGVVAFWLVLGIIGAIVATGFDPSRIFGYWYIMLGLGIVILVFGIGCMGVFEMQVPASISRFNPRADSMQGSFMFGVMTGILGLPCFGFVAGGLLAGSAALPGVAILAIFFGLGVGMAAPYLILSVKPELLAWLPRSGPAGVLVKQVLGLMMIAASLFFIGVGVRTLVANYPYLAPHMHWWLVAGTLAAAGVWLAIRTIQLAEKPAFKFGIPVVGMLFLAVFPLTYAWNTTMTAREQALDGTWVHYEPGEIERSIATGKVVVVDFTADWCVTCKAIKAAVLDPDPVGSRLKDDDIIAIEVDLTVTAAPGWAKLHAIGRTGIPTLAIYGPGLDEPWIRNAYTASDVINAIDRAGGTASAVIPASQEVLKPSG